MQRPNRWWRMCRTGSRGTLAGLGLAALAAAQVPQPPVSPPAGQDPELAALLDEERRDADLERRRGKVESAKSRFEELLDENPADGLARTLLAQCLLDLAQPALAEQEAARALADLGKAPVEAQAAARRLLATLQRLRGRSTEALASAAGLRPQEDPRDALVLGRCQLEAGQREEAWKSFGQGTRAPAGADWERWLALARCKQALGDLVGASQALVQAEKHAGGPEPDVLCAWGEVYFEADREIEEAQQRSASELAREALRLHPLHEDAQLLLYRLHRVNWRRDSKSATQILGEYLARRPDSIEALLLAAGNDLDDGQLRAARGRLAQLDRLAGGRRALRTLHAALAIVEHRREDGRKILAELAAADPKDALPEREVGRHLLELYRFAEGLEFVRAATERDPTDHEAWTQYGRALANTGAETEALAALEKAQELARGRQDAWRNNLRVVLSKMAREHKREGHGDLEFAWNEDAAEILREYLVPFYASSRAELARRYGFTPGPTAIEVFAKHQDFSVRSTGFEGFPALGVCFGPVVTAVSPLSELRGTFSWARTSYHEFTHVIHLGLSHNRCPRWITEGLATWEEVEKNPAWTRNMRRELVDAFANEDLIPVRELNRAFRGPRILFGYYQGGLLCRMLIDEHGFPPMVRLLEAFDRGLDLDQAFREVFQATPEEVDLRFHAFVAREIAGLRIEPRWTSTTAQRLRLALGRARPSEAGARARWIDGWCSIAWQAWQEQRRVDAQEALRVLGDERPEPARASFLRGEMALAAGKKEEARAIWEAALAAGGDDFRARIALAVLGDPETEPEFVEGQLKAAEALFPGYAERPLSAELLLAAFYDKAGRVDDALAAKERWLAYESGAPAETLEVARWHAGHARHERAAAFFARANEIDPFQWKLHADWAAALRALKRTAEAEREYRIALAVPAAHEGDEGGPADETQRAALHGGRAWALLELGRREEALVAARAALELDAECADARTVLERAR